jgi:uncharacterized protein (DUF3820 family)
MSKQPVIPVKELTDQSPITFGKFRGRALVDVPAIYLLYIYDNDMVYDPAVKKYIENNIEVLKKEAGRK